MVSSVVVSHCPINIYRVLYCRRNSSVLHFCFLRMDFPDYSASLEAALGLRTAIPIVLPVGIVLRGRGESRTGCRSGNVYPVERITSVRFRCYALRPGAVLACGEDLGSRMKSRVRDPECSVAAVGSHISAEDNGWSYMRSGSFSQTGTDSSYNCWCLPAVGITGGFLGA